MQKSFDDFTAEFVVYIKKVKSLDQDYSKLEKLMMKLVIEINDTVEKKHKCFTDPTILKKIAQLQSIIIVIDICAKIDNHMKTHYDKIYLVDLYPYLSDDALYKLKYINKTQVVHLIIPLLRKELGEKKYNTFVSPDTLLQTKIVCSKDAFNQKDLIKQISCVDIIQNKLVDYCIS